MELEASLTRRATQRDRTKNRVFTRDFSSEGAYLRADTALSVDEPVELQLPLPSTNRLEAGGLVVIFGTVVRVDRFPDGKFGLAVRFDSWLLNSFLQSKLRGPG